MSFNNTQLVTVTINGKHWTRAREPVKAMYEKKTKPAHNISLNGQGTQFIYLNERYVKDL